MSISSMTGFARVDGQNNSVSWIWEARAVNGRGLDIRFRLPGFLSSIEDDLRKKIRSRFKRGNVQINLQLETDKEEATSLTVNLDLAHKIIRQFQPMIDQELVEKPTVSGLLGVRGMLEVTAPSLSLDELQQPLFDSFQQLIDQLAMARANEGLAIKSSLQTTLSRMEELVADCRNNPALRPAAILQRLQAQVTALGETIPAERLAQEVALLAIKADINEELERLRGHIDAAQQLLLSTIAVGRKFEFLCQELNREANTLCAKSSDQQLTNAGLELKTLIDQIKEQAANVE